MARMSLGKRPLLAELKERAGEVRDFCGTNENIKLVARMWVKIEPASAQEVVQGDQVENQITHKITARYISGVRPDQWLVVQGHRVFHIKKAVNVEETSRWLSIDCIEAERDG